MLSASVVWPDNALRRTAVSHNPGRSVIAGIIDNVPAMIAQWAGGEPERGEASPMAS